MATEKVKFKIELYATMWDRPPHAKISISNKEIFDGDITGSADQPDVISLETELTEGSDYELIIERSGKTLNQTVVDSDGKISKDQLLNIKSIEIDEIDIGALVFNGVYTPEYPEPWRTQQKASGNELPESFKNVTQLGHNGRWTFKFASPFYMWLLENLY